MCKDKTHVLPDELADLRATLTEGTKPATLPGVVANAAAMTLDGAATLLRSLAWRSGQSDISHSAMDAQAIQRIINLLQTCIGLIMGNITPHNWEEK